MCGKRNRQLQVNLKRNQRKKSSDHEHEEIDFFPLMIFFSCFFHGEICIVVSFDNLSIHVGFALLRGHYSFSFEWSVTGCTTVREKEQDTELQQKSGAEESERSKRRREMINDHDTKPSLQKQ